ncbi:MAG TPA: TlpA disulfide reductase family protein [Usitatibacter sp.]
MKARWVFGGVALLALLAGSALWLGTRPGTSSAPAVEVSPAALLAAGFASTDGTATSLGRFQGKVMVVNFWATWCAPCREEMPAFARLQAKWAPRGVQFVGLSSEEPGLVERFAAGLRLNYPVWVGGDEVGDLARRLGNHLGVLPFTVLLDRQGRVVDRKVGPYTEADLDSRLAVISAN